MSRLSFPSPPQANAQCSQSLGADTTLCPGDSVLLQSQAGYLSYLWDNGDTLPDRTVHTSGTYWCEVVCHGPNLVVNGDFSQGNTGFTSSYGYATQLSSQGLYWVGDSAHLCHNLFMGTDHTTGSGNFMIVNGAEIPGVEVWCQTVTVQPNTYYNFSTWVSSVHPVIRLP